MTLLGIEVREDVVRAGERISGIVTVLRPGLQDVRVGLLRRERSPDGEQTVEQVLAPGVEGVEDYGEGARISFEVPVPEEALPSVSGQKCEVFWEVVGKTDYVGEANTASAEVRVLARRAGDPA